MNRVNKKVISINKSGKYSFHIKFDADGVEDLIEELKAALNGIHANLRLSNASRIDQKQIRSLTISCSNEQDTLSYKESGLFLQLEDEVIEYIMSRLERCLTGDDFYPAELCEVTFGNRDMMIYGELDHRNPYEIRVTEDVNEICPGSYDHMNKISEYPPETGLKLLIVLIEYACKGTNIGPILLARSQIKKIPSCWLVSFFPEATKQSVDFNDEWEFRRLLELVHEAVPQLLKNYVEIGLASENKEVKEAAEDFATRVIT
ncbi:hypothetical protein SAMN05661091_1200 [Paenibacillus uliginis N3/975]|uniref:Uncharacterized protein n=1 Tax=Paenibacillus uliginis N3/975 TaxID=1313296 RepID=A0A1X7GXG3_9BACL|nr:hypothetical protein [Paenibacillus uliginis]SMF75423.1 hypothetical protein SAMN05661091_1200 [Paenibacillus uliginis N3/975]